MARRARDSPRRRAAVAERLSGRTGPEAAPVISRQALTVLRELASTAACECDGSTLPAGRRSVAEIVRAVRVPGSTLQVTRASVSRTLRRLWRDGLVDLFAGWRSMSDARAEGAARLAEKEADPEQAYRDYCELMENIGLSDSCGSAEAYIAFQRRRLTRPDMRVTTVQITDAGRERLTPSCTTKLTDRPSTVRARRRRGRRP
jgi:hypothetical protein